MICIVIHAEAIPVPTLTVAAEPGCQVFSGAHLRRLPKVMQQHSFEIALSAAFAESDFAGSGTQNLGTANFSQLLGTTQSIGVTQYFEPATIWAGENSVLKIDLVNFFANPIDADSLSLTDTLPSGVTVTGAASDIDDCGISVTAAVGSGSIVLNGGSIPAGAACEIDVPVTSATASATPYVNTIAAGAMTAKIEGVTASNGGPATAPLAVTKNITGIAASVITSSLRFPYSVTCVTPTATYVGDITVGTGSPIGSDNL